MSETNEISEDEKTGELLGAFRFPQIGVIEKLVIQHLLQATFTKEPDVMIYHVCAAVGIVEKLENKNLAKLDFDLFRKIATLNNAFSDMKIKKIDQYNIMMCQIPWGFSATEENYKEYIEPWEVAASCYTKFITMNTQRAYQILHAPRRRYSPNEYEVERCGQPLFLLTENTTQKKFGVPLYESDFKKVNEYIWKKLPNDCPKCKEYIHRYEFHRKELRVVDYSVPWSLFFEKSDCLTEIGFKNLKRAFEKWATEPCEHAITYLCSIVSPKTYDEMYKMMSGKLKTQNEGEEF